MAISQDNPKIHEIVTGLAIYTYYFNGGKNG